MTDPTDPLPRSNRLLLLFLGTTFLSSLGSVAALLASTVVSSDAGGTGAEAATYTSLMLALNLIMASVTTPYAPSLGHRFGVRRVYGIALALNVLLYAALAAAIFIGLPGFPALMVVTPLLGALGGVSHAMSPTVLKSYLAGEDLASAETKTSVASGIAWVIGAVGGALVIDAIGPAYAFAGNAVLTLTFVLVVVLVPPAVAVGRPTPQHHPWRAVWTSLRGNPRLIRASVLGLIAAALVIPLASMVVPVTRDLDHDLAIHAGLILAAISLGAVVSPLPVGQIGTRLSALRSSALSYATVGVVLIVLAVLTVLLTANVQLVAIAAVAVIYGAMESAGGNLLIEGAADSADQVEQEQQNLAVFFLVTGLGAPIGTLLWGRTIDALSATFVFAAAGVLMVIFIVLVVVVLSRTGRAIDLPPAITPKTPAKTPERTVPRRHTPILSRLWH